MSPIDDDTRWPWETDSDENAEPAPQLNISNEFNEPRPFAYGSEGQRRSQRVQRKPEQREQRKPEQREQRKPEQREQRKPEQREQREQAPSSDLAFAQEMLDAHNRYRASHQAAPLSLDRDLTQRAQWWAEKMASQDRLVPDVELNDGSAGENLAMRVCLNKTTFSGAEFTDNWYSGIVDYDFKNHVPSPRKGSAALNFTQIVWKNTRRAGFAKAVSSSGRVYAVGRYLPAGNAVNEFRQNVSPLTSPSDGRASGPESAQSSRRSRIQQREPVDSVEGRPSDARQSSRQSSRHTSAGRGGITENKSSSRLSEVHSPVIGAMRPTDTLVSTSKSTRREQGTTVVTIEEKYATQDGGTYTRKRTMTYVGERRD